MFARTAVALALAVTSVSPSLVRAADPRVALARAKEATGGARWDAVRTTYARTKVRSGGLEGVVESWGDVRRGRHVRRYTFGPTRGGAGYDGTQAWSQDDSGQVRIEEGADAREGAVNEAYRTALAYWFPDRWPAAIEDGGEKREGDRRFTVVRITPRGGRPFDLWVDVATGLVDRRAEKDATRVRTTFLSDYREVAGLHVPFAIRETTGDPKYDAFFTLEDISFDAPLEEARFAPPPPPPPDFAIAGEAVTATVPFALVNNHIYVDVRLNGKGPFRFLCDTGGSNFMTPAVARALGVETQGALEARGAGEKSETVALARIGTLELGDVSLRDQLFTVAPFDELSAVEGLEVQGLVGYEIFKRFAVTIDYPARKLTVHAPGTLREEGLGAALPFRFDEHVPQVEGALDGIPGTFWIDTGSRGSLALERAFADRHGLVQRYRARLKAVTGWGIGGPARALLARAGRLTLGDGVVVERPVIDISASEGGGPANQYIAGNIGGAILKQFAVTFDYARQRILFGRKGATTVEPYDRSGLWLNLGKGGAFEVMDVIPGGPGAKAKLRVGDRIVAVGGKPASGLTLGDLRERLRTGPAGSRVELTVESGGRRRIATVVLADLV